MKIISVTPHTGNPAFYKRAYALALITVFYNLIEGVVSVVFGFEDGAVTLFGFGVDSFVEVISGVGIWHMTRRMKRNGSMSPDAFEKTALKVTGTAFYILTAGLVFISLIDLYEGYKPETTFWGIVVSIVSILSMWVLIHYKVRIGTRFNSQALLADAACSKTCLWLSVVLLIASVGYEVTGIGMMDSIGAMVIAGLSYREGREAFEKARGNLTCACGKCG